LDWKDILTITEQTIVSDKTLYQHIQEQRACLSPQEVLKLMDNCLLSFGTVRELMKLLPRSFLALEKVFQFRDELFEQFVTILQPSKYD
jgi:hypothetical protein